MQFDPPLPNAGEGSRFGDYEISGSDKRLRHLEPADTLASSNDASTRAIPFGPMSTICVWRSHSTYRSLCSFVRTSLPVGVLSPGNEILSGDGAVRIRVE